MFLTDIHNSNMTEFIATLFLLFLISRLAALLNIQGMLGRARQHVLCNISKTKLPDMM